MSPTSDHRKRATAPRMIGSNLTTVRSTNERLILHLVRTHEQLTKADATRLTKLSANAVSVIFRSLEEAGFLLRCAPIRGRIGQPSTPMRLNPAARYYAGLYLGRRSYRLVIIDFVGNILARQTSIHNYPTPTSLIAFIKQALPMVLDQSGIKQSQLDAFNIAAPGELWSWTPELGIAKEEMEPWRFFNLRDEVATLVRLPVEIENDGTSACRAELVFGGKRAAMDWAYFYVESFIGGGIVLNGSVYPGRRSHAGGFGPLRVPEQAGGSRLMDHASLVTLEHLVKSEPEEAIERIYSDELNWSSIEQPLDAWIKRAGKSLTYAIVSSLTVVDFEDFVIDGALPVHVRDRLLNEIREQWELLDRQGIDTPQISPGKFGAIAGALGAAAIQISNDFMINQHQVLQSDPTFVSSGR